MFGVGVDKHHRRGTWHGPSGRVGFTHGWSLFKADATLVDSGAFRVERAEDPEALLRVKCRSQTAFAILQDDIAAADSSNNKVLRFIPDRWWPIPK